MKINTKLYSKLNTIKEQHQNEDFNSHIVRFRYSWAYISIALTFLLTISIFIYASFVDSPIENYRYLGKFVYLKEENLANEVDINWRKCQAEKYGKINELKIEPTSINLNKNLTIYFDGDVYEDLLSPISVQVKIKKKIWFSWIEVPCLKDIGSCHYGDICELSPYAHNSSCVLPIPNAKLPCKCPIEKGNYFMNASTVYIKDPSKYIPKWLERGSYYVRVQGFHTGSSIGCYEFLFKIA